MANIIETFPKGGGATSLSNLTDVELTSPAEGDLLQYDATEQKWVNSAKIPQKVAGLQKTGCVNRFQNTANSSVYSGITYTVNANKTVTVGGVSTAQDGFILNGWVSDGSMQGLKLVGCPAGGSNARYYLCFYNVTKGTETSDFGDGAIINNDFAGDTVRVYISVRNGVDLSTAVTFKPMLTPDLSATYADYQPYSMTNRELTEGKFIIRSTHNITTNGNGGVQIPVPAGYIPIFIDGSFTGTTYTYNYLFSRMPTTARNLYVVVVDNVSGTGLSRVPNMTINNLLVFWIKAPDADTAP